MFNPVMRKLLSFILVVALILPVISGCGARTGRVNSFSELILNAERFNGRQMELEAFYFSGFEISVLCGALEATPSVKPGIAPVGPLIWVEGGLPQDVFDRLYTQTDTPSGYPQHFGKLKVSGRFETRGVFGHLNAYLHQMTVTRAEWLEWSPSPAAAGPSAGFTTQSPDDIVNTPGGSAYRANVHQQGVQNPWPTIVTAEKQLTAGSNTITVRYRHEITSLAGATRRNIINIRMENSRFENSGATVLNLSVSDNPAGIHLSQQTAAGLPGTLAALLQIEIAEDVSPGKYELDIGLSIAGINYGSLPCTLSVTRG